MYVKKMASERTKREMDRQLCQLFHFNGYRVIDASKIERERENERTKASNTHTHTNTQDHFVAAKYSLAAKWIQLPCVCERELV